MSSFMQQPLATASRRLPALAAVPAGPGRDELGKAHLCRRGAPRTGSTPASPRCATTTGWPRPRSTSPDALPEALREISAGRAWCSSTALTRPPCPTCTSCPGACLSAASRMPATEQAARIAEHLDSSFDPQDHPFAALNTATLRDGVFVEIAGMRSSKRPADCLAGARRRCAHGHEPASAAARRYQQLGPVSWSSSPPWSGAEASFCSGVTELLLGSGAQADAPPLHEESGEAMHIGAVHARLESTHSWPASTWPSAACSSASTWWWITPAAAPTRSSTACICRAATNTSTITRRSSTRCPTAPATRSFAASSPIGPRRSSTAAFISTPMRRRPAPSCPTRTCSPARKPR
jgi:hypothetical protein